MTSTATTEQIANLAGKTVTSAEWCPVTEVDGRSVWALTLKFDNDVIVDVWADAAGSSSPFVLATYPTSQCNENHSNFDITSN